MERQRDWQKESDRNSRRCCSGQLLADDPRAFARFQQNEGERSSRRNASQGRRESLQGRARSNTRAPCKIRPLGSCAFGRAGGCCRKIELNVIRSESWRESCKKSQRTRIWG